MAKRLSKKKTPTDINQLAAFIVKETTKESPSTISKSSKPSHSKRTSRINK